MSYSVLSNPNPDKLQLAKVTGKNDYADDHAFGGALYTAYLGSPYPHAKITAIDTSAAEALAGVKAVTTYKDCPVFTQELFYVGQEVAAVAATSRNIATQAASLISVTYQVLPYVTDLDKAIANTTLSGVLPNTNEVGEPLEASWGDITAGFATAGVVVAEDTVGMSAGFQHSTCEPRSCIAIWDESMQDKLTVYTDSQNPFGQRSAIAGALGIPLGDVTVITHGTGGGFGDKHFSEWCVVAAVLAKKAGAPVVNHLSRKDNYLTATQQYPNRAHIKIGATSDGTIVAIDAEYWTDVGAAPWPAVGDAISPLQITFNVANAHFKGHSITTNKPRCYYWRTVGEPGGLFLMDIVLEELAAKLSMDPLQLRMKNIKKLGDLDNGSLGLNTGQKGLPFASMALDQCFQKVADGIGWTSKWHAAGAKTLPDGRMHGIGVSGYVCNKGQWGGEVDGAIITSTTDGKFFLMIGQSSINTEASTQTYVAAEAIGCKGEDVKLGDYGNTATCQNCGAQGGSTRTVTTGHAVRQAGFDVRNQLFTYAAPMLHTTTDKLSASLGKIYLTSDPTQFVTIAAVLADAGTPPIIGKGYTPYDNSKVIRTTPAAAVEIAVDTDTGAIEVLNITSACDVGTANSKLGCEGQIEGGACQSLGHQLFWGWDYDASNGIPMNPSFLFQKPETIMDCPAPTNLTPYVVESHDALGPFGAKGLGEPPYGTIGSAMSSAIYNATGKYVRAQPSTPWAVLQALGKSM